MLIKNVSDSELDELIDSILVMFKGHMILSNDIFKQAREKGNIDQDKWKLYEFRVIRKMSEFGLITISEQFGGQENYELTPFGRDVLKHESWTKYRESKHQKEIDDAKLIHAAANQNWFNRNSGMIAILISAAALVVTVRQCQLDNQKSPDTTPGTTIPDTSASNLKSDHPTLSNQTKDSTSESRSSLIQPPDSSKKN